MFIIFLLSSLFCPCSQAKSCTDFKSVGTLGVSDGAKKEERPENDPSHPGIAGNSDCC